MPCIELSQGFYKKLRREASKRDVSVEELVAETSSEALGVPLDPRDRAELHLELCEKYLREAEKLLAEGDYSQASEKGWGAAAQIVKALAAREGKALRSHRELWEYVDELVEKLGDAEVRRLWHAANALHQNFYESWMTPKSVAAALEDVKLFVRKLRKLLQTSDCPAR
ncbi:MAG: PaREP1 family protein [Thermofilum sp.]|nr:PaREP1 family protein [Thermofilum sp.]